MKNNTVIISNKKINFSEFNPLLDIFIDELEEKYANGFDIETITEDYTTFTKSIRFKTEFTLEQLLAVDSVYKLGDTLFFNGEQVNLAK